jgi:hypothetical protein
MKIGLNPGRQGESARAAATQRFVTVVVAGILRLAY